MVCKCCGKDKPKSEFYADKNSKSGVRSKCKACVIEGVQKRYWEKRDEIREKQRAYYQSHKDYYKEKSRKWYQKKREETLRL